MPYPKVPQGRICMTVCVPMWGAECWATRCHLQGREPPLLWAVDLPGYNSSHPVLETPPDDSGPGEQQRQHKRLGPPASAACRLVWQKLLAQ